MTTGIKNRIKSFLWRAAGTAVIAGGAYILKIGDLWKLDYHVLVNLTVLAVIVLVVGEVTKYMNSTPDPAPSGMEAEAEIPVTNIGQ